MANPRIDVEINAKVEGVTEGVSAATGQLDKLGKAAQTAAPQVDKLSKSTSNYNAVGVNFARLIQDAPFGIIGVGNNITALAESLQNASNQGKTFTQILGGVFSAGNLLTLGISALVTGYTIYQQNAEKTITLNDKVKESYDDIADSVESLAKKLAALDLVNEVINKQVDEVLKLNESFTIFNLTAEDFSKITTDAFSKLNQEQLSGIKSSLTELANDQLKIVGNALNLTRKEAISFIEGLKGNSTAFEALDPKIRDAANSYNNLTAKVKIANNQLDFYNDKADKVDAGKEALERYSKAWDTYNLRLEESKILTNRATQENAELEKKLLAINKAFFELPKKPVEVKIKTDFEVEAEAVDELPFIDQLLAALNGKRFTEFEERLAEFAFNVKDILQNNLANAFIDLGYTIGETLATGGNIIKAVGNSILKSFGRFLGQFGEQLIAYGVATIAFGKASLALINPFTAPAAGAIAIAAGIALTAISGFIGTIGQGGIGGGNSVGSNGVGAGTTFVGGGAQSALFQGSRDVTGEFVVRGQDLVYVIGQAGNKLNKG
jgi:uncharacterized surface protein with fasciclin (FAS1) repeats